MRPKTYILAVLLVFLISACLPRNSTTQPLPSAVTQNPIGMPAQTSISPPPSAVSSASGWVEYRDARYGYGLALPCYWLVTPTPKEGMFAAMTARSYSDDFFAAHSERGEWTDGDWPEGAYKLDALVFEGIAPSSGTEDAIRDFVTENLNEQELVSLEEMTFGRRTGYIATLQSGLQGGIAQRIVYFPIRTDALVALVFQPDSALDSPDIQAILSSFASVADNPIAFPGQVPAGPPGAGSPMCR